MAMLHPPLQRNMKKALTKARMRSFAILSRIDGGVYFSLSWDCTPTKGSVAVPREDEVVRSQGAV